MAGILEREWNQTASKAVVNTEVLNDWVAIQVESTHSNPLYLQQISYGIAPSAVADIAIVPIVNCAVMRGFKIEDKALTLGQLFSNRDSFTLHQDFTNEMKVKDHLWIPSYKLQPGFIYTFLMWMGLSSAAFAGTVFFNLTVNGDTVPMYQPQPMPVKPRVGTDEPLLMEQQT